MGSLLYNEYMGGSKNTPFSDNSVLSKTVLWNRQNGSTSNGIITISAIKTGTTDADVLAGMDWKEIK